MAFEAVKSLKVCLQDAGLAVAVVDSLLDAAGDVCLVPTDHADAETHHHHRHRN